MVHAEGSESTKLLEKTLQHDPTAQRVGLPAPEAILPPYQGRESTAEYALALT